jgi:CRISPR-associated endonuclease/helicase Cas3
MEITVVCRSRKKMRNKSAAILDRYLFRIGDRTWRGRASFECLRRISTDRKKSASRNMSVAVYRAGAKSQHQRPLFIVGSKQRFSPEGHCPISLRSKHKKFEKTSIEQTIQAIVEIGALFHDVGKATRMFQRKIVLAASAQKEGSPMADPVRHEAFSTAMFEALVPPGHQDGPAIANALLDALNNPKKIEHACHAAALKCAKLHESNQPSREILSFAGDIGSANLRSQILLLILGHHRLPAARHLEGRVECAVHVSNKRILHPDDLNIEEGLPFWNENWFQKRLRKACAALNSSFAKEPKALDIYARLPLMMADHIGSSESERGDFTGHLANTKQDPNGPGDSLSQHVQRVLRAARPMAIGVARSQWSFPSIDIDEIPYAVKNPIINGTLFDWQARAGQAAAQISSEKEGGFFGVLRSGTGTGKTRGAAIVMGAATLNDANEDRRGLRYNIALPLRTLARQAGIEYIEDLRFSPLDVVTMIGGDTSNLNSDNNSDNLSCLGELSGSENRLIDMDSIQLFSENPDELKIDYSAMGVDLDRRLPAFADRFCMAARRNESKVRRLLSTPILAATIDHLMPAASPLRGSYIASMLRTITADLVIDEIDLLSDEDISAVKRLIRIVGLAGRRVLLMSATMPDDIAQSFYKVYIDSYEQYAANTNSENHVNFLCAADAAGSISTSTTHDNFSKAFLHCSKKIDEKLSAQKTIHFAEILRRAENWDDQVEIISESCDEMHRRHSFSAEGLNISVGLVRITRIQHLQSLSVELGKKQCTDRGYCILHSNMPKIQRENIEQNLKQALTRKGENPNSSLVDFLRSRGLIAHARKHGSKDIKIIVLASPVIETGNDVDFDWLISDPSSVRSSIQAAGRINRHRRHPVSTPNIALLGDYCVSRTAGKMEYPGPETKPVSETGVSHTTIEINRSTKSLIGRSSPFPLDARLASCVNTPLSQYEKITREKFDKISAIDFEAPLFWWTTPLGKKHKFRRSTRINRDLIPLTNSQSEVSWVFYPNKSSQKPSDVRVRLKTNSLFNGYNIFPDGLVDLMRNAESYKENKPMKSCCLSVEIYSDDEIANLFYLDPVLGLLKNDENISPPEFQST